MKAITPCSNPRCASCADAAVDGEARRVACEARAVRAMDPEQAGAYMARVTKIRGPAGAKHLRDAIRRAAA